MALDPATLAPMKVDYEESSLTVAAIGEKYGCSASYVSRMARTHMDGSCARSGSAARRGCRRS